MKEVIKGSCKYFSIQPMSNLFILFAEKPKDITPMAQTLGDRPEAASTTQEVMDVEGVHLEERTQETSQQEEPELSLSFQGYVAELRQCQTKMRTVQLPPTGRNPPEGNDCKTELYKATIV